MLLYVVVVVVVVVVVAAVAATSCNISDSSFCVACLTAESLFVNQVGMQVLLVYCF